MNKAHLPYLVCPVSRKKLSFIHLDSASEQQIKNGFLGTDEGIYYPVIEGVPRMLIESIIDYEDFFKQHLEDFDGYKAFLYSSYKDLILHRYQHNKRTKDAFHLEWKFFQPEKDKLWNQPLANLPEIIEDELGSKLAQLNNKTVLDAGCGHGENSAVFQQNSKMVIGIELSKAIETAYQRQGDKENILFVQGDLQYPPFANNSFDVVYSSGVLHHTENTELSLTILTEVLKPKGLISVWLYHPRENSYHQFILTVRQFLARMPVQILFRLIQIVLAPVLWLLHKLKINKESPTYREITIDLMDSFGPKFRFEVEEDVAKSWLRKRQFKDIMTTSRNQFGFSMIGTKV